MKQLNPGRLTNIFLLMLTIYYVVLGGMLLNNYVAPTVAEQVIVPKPELAQEVAKPKLRPRPVNVQHTSDNLLTTISYQVMHDNQLEDQYVRGQPRFINKAEQYATLPGVTCFRGNNYRSAPSYGRATIKEAKLAPIWDVTIGGLGEWTGVGWNGQPAIVKWDDQWKMRMNINDNKKQKAGLKEVIYATLDGKVYFLDLDNGEVTRPPIQIPGPVKGSLTVDPRGLPLLYVGQGISGGGQMGYRIFSLIDQQLLYFINGYDSFAYRGWGAFDSTSLVNSNTDTLFVGGENGIFYSVKLNSNYNQQANQISVNPVLTKYRYRCSAKGDHQGIENSTVLYKNFAYFADNGGVLQCVDTDTMRPIWARNVTDDTDGTCVLDEEDEQNVFLYTACEVDKQGAGGYCYVRKFDALTGEPQWERQYQCYLNTHTNGGALATPIVGKENIADLVVFNIARHGTANGGILVALDKYSGQEVWTLPLPNYCWSSPVDVYTKNGEGYIVVCDSVGAMHLIYGNTGQILDSISLGSNVEGSPSVYENTIVVGTRGQKIYGVVIR